MLAIQEPHHLDDVSFAEAEGPEVAGIDVRKHTLVHVVFDECLCIPVAQAEGNIAVEEELEPVVVGLLRLERGADFRALRVLRLGMLLHLGLALHA